MSNLADLNIQEIINRNEIISSRQLFDYLKDNYSYDGCKRSVERFVNKSNLHFARDNRERRLDILVNGSIRRFGDSYGRRMLRGALESEGQSFSEREVRASMLRVAPDAVAHRANNSHRLLNPMKYVAPYFGYAFHLDQHEKLTQYGCTTVACIDGHSFKILGFVVTSFKNNISILRDLYLPIVSNYGLPEQLLVDCGKEFNLILFAQDALKHYRQFSDGTMSTRPPYRQIKSTQNNRVERLWREVNERIAYPIRYAMIEIENGGEIDINDDYHRFCIGIIIRHLVKHMLQQFMAHWNCHYTCGIGNPNEKAQNNNCFQLPNGELPNADHFVHLYRETGGKLTEEHHFGMDAVPVEKKSSRDQAVENVIKTYGDYQGIAEAIHGKNYNILAKCIFDVIKTNCSYY